jgi:general secretion pathway protein G
MNQAGFTLIELLVVISIIGILAGLLLTNFVGIRERAVDTRTKNDLQQLKKALRLYYNDHQEYPDTNDGPTPGGSFEDGDSVYMKDTPTEFEYTQTNNGEGFVLIAPLENASDEDIIDSQARCDVEAEENEYVVCED